MKIQRSGRTSAKGLTYHTSQKKKLNTSAKSGEISGIFVVASSVFFAFTLFFESSGWMGDKLRSVFLGSIGRAAYAAPFVLCWSGIKLYFKKEGRKIRHYVLLATFLISVSVVVSLLEYDDVITADGFMELWYYGEGGTGGGAFGGLFCGWLIAAFGFFGAWILSLSVLLAILVALTSVSIVSIAQYCLDKIKDKADDLMIEETAEEKFNMPKNETKPNKKQGKSKVKTESTDYFKNYFLPNQEEVQNDSEDNPTVVLDEAITSDPVLAHNESRSPNIQLNYVDSHFNDYAYELPPISLLSKPMIIKKAAAVAKRELEEKAAKLLDTLKSFGVEASIYNVSQGPTVTRFELQPGVGVKVNKITNLSVDIALSLAAAAVRIEAPIPGKSAIGIEIPNTVANNVTVREVIASEKFANFSSKTAFALGKDTAGNGIIADIADMPHLLIAGATGSGKSVCINTLIISIIYKAKPTEVKMIMVDPKMVELGGYNGIPHLLIPVVTDPNRAAGALNWAVGEMKRRYELFKENKVKNIGSFNDKMRYERSLNPKEEKIECLPEIIIIIDELADLMMVAKSEVEDSINSLAALARAAGMYLVLATQRPSVNVITGVIKANVPSRISFAVSSQVDSRTILDGVGAEKLLGKGDMLYYPRGASKPLRVQGNFVSDKEVENIVEYIKQFECNSYNEDVMKQIEILGEDGGAKDDVLFSAIEFAIEMGQVSASSLQRKFKIGYKKACRIIDQMEERKIIGPSEGSKPRKVLVNEAE